MSELGLTYRQAAAKSERGVSHATLNSIAVGRHSWKLDDRTIDGIAAALDVSVERVRAAAGQAARETPTRRFELPPRADRLSERERRAVLGMVDALLAAADRATVDRADDGDSRARRAVDREIDSTGGVTSV